MHRNKRAKTLCLSFKQIYLCLGLIATGAVCISLALLHGMSKGIQIKHTNSNEGVGSAITGSVAFDSTSAHQQRSTGASNAFEPGLPLVRDRDSSPFVTICQTNEPKRKKAHPPGEGASRKFMVDDAALRKNRENDLARAKSFSKIYEEGLWGGGEIVNGKQFGGSGPGSLMSSTVQVRKTLDIVIERTKLELGKDRIRMLDLPCGDLVWMKHYLNNRTDVDYTGMDIVGSLIAEHSKAFSDTHPWTFQQHDIVKDPLQVKYDLIFSRQMTQHLGTEDTMKVLQHFSEGASYLLITNYLDLTRNIPLNTNTAWRFRPQNFNISPYAITDPICEDEETGCVNALYKLPLQQWL